MVTKYIISAIILSILPIAELRGGIPTAVLLGKMGHVQAYLMCVGLNALVGPLVHIFLSTFHKLFIKWNWYANLFEKIVTKARKKLHDKVEKYGYFGLTIFVAIPLPITGAYTGTLGAWIMNMDKKKTFLCVALGCMISGLIVTTLVYIGPEALGSLYKVFVKEAH